MRLPILPFAALFLASVTATAVSDPSQEATLPDTLQPEHARKLSPEGKMLLAQPGAAAAGRELSVLLRGRGPIREPERVELERRGAKVRTVAGNVASATVTLEALPHLLAFDFVTAVEISRPLRPE